MIIVLQRHPVLWDKVPSMDVSLPRMLHFSFFKPYDEARGQQLDVRNGFPRSHLLTLCGATNTASASSSWGSPSGFRNILRFSSR